MKFSICSWIFGSTSIEDVIKFASRVGYDEVEVSAAVDQQDWKNIKSIAEDSNIHIRGINADATFLRPETDLSSENEELRANAVNYFKRQLDVGSYLEAEYMVLAPAAPGRSIPYKSEEEDWQWGVESIKSLALYAKEKGITIVIEPLNRYESCLVNNADDALSFINAVNEENVKTMLDTFHMNIEEQNFEGPFKKLKSVLETIHVADSNREGIGRGHIPFEEIAKTIKGIGYDKSITLECLVPGKNPFSAERSDMKAIFQYAEESLQLMRELFN